MKIIYLFVISLVAVSCSSFAWSSSINSIFSAKTFLDLTIGAETNLIKAIGNGAQMAMNECQTAFHWERWNCPITDFSKKQRQYLTREQAVVQSILSAGVTYAVLKNCSNGLISGCGCNTKVFKYDVLDFIPFTRKNFYEYLTDRSEKVNFISKICDADIEFAENISKTMLDTQVMGNDLQAKINLHNNNLGRKLVQSNMYKKCRCHGTSGSCNLQTCWMELRSFATIANKIKSKYNQAKQIELGNSRLLPSNFENNIKNTNDETLLFLDETENLCIPNNKTGWPGTKGRVCSRERVETTTVGEKKSCRTLCRTCGYKVRKSKRLESWKCNCSFKWCCDVECQSCTGLVNELHCY